MWLENRFVFRPVRASVGWNPKPSDEVRDVRFTDHEGTELHAWWQPRGADNGVILYCHGNGGNLSCCGRVMERLSRFLGRAVFVFDYPGYGNSAGRPSESGCYAAADGAYGWLIEQGISPDRIVLHGDSLGGGVATELATRRAHHALVLVKTFTSLPDAAKQIYPYLPVKSLMRNRFDSLSKIARCKSPVLIASGTEDRVTPFEQGRKLFEAANEPKRFVPLEGSEHNAFIPDGFFEILAEFLDSHPPG